MFENSSTILLIVLARAGVSLQKMDTIVGAMFLILIMIAAALAIPLMVVTHSGRP